MGETEDINEETFWKKKVKEFWKVLIVLIVAVVCIIIGVFLVLIWFINTSTIGGMGHWHIEDWTLNYVLGFIILLCLWELLFVGVPTVLFFGVGGYLWWRRLPEEKKQEFRTREKKEKKHKKEKYGGGGGGSIFLFIAYCIYHAVMGTYNAPFGWYSYTYWLYSFFYLIAWMLIVLGGPVVIILIIVYFVKWRKK
ncbi:MAG: hypothetical protein ACFFEN_14830 [Candidatus Thorarchaeota archaeon]